MAIIMAAQMRGALAPCRHALSISQGLSQLILLAILGGRHHYYPYFLIRTLRYSEVSKLAKVAQQIVALGINPGLSDSKDQFKKTEIKNEG